jgi:hypothetical protein
MAKKHKRSTPGAFGRSTLQRAAKYGAQNADASLVALGFKPRMQGVYLVYAHQFLGYNTRFGNLASWQFVNTAEFQREAALSKIDLTKAIAPSKLVTCVECNNSLRYFYAPEDLTEIKCTNCGAVGSIHIVNGTAEGAQDGQHPTA